MHYIHTWLLQFGSSHSLRVQHMLTQIAFSFIPAAISVMVYAVSTDSSVIIAVIFVQVVFILSMLILYLVMVVLPSMAQRVIPSASIEASTADYSNNERTNEHVAYTTADAFQHAIENDDDNNNDENDDENNDDDIDDDQNSVRHAVRVNGRECSD